MGELSSQTVQGAIIQWNDLPGENDLFCELKKKKGEVISSYLILLKLDPDPQKSMERLQWLHVIWSKFFRICHWNIIG